MLMQFINVKGGSCGRWGGGLEGGMGGARGELRAMGGREGRSQILILWILLGVMYDYWRTRICCVPCWFNEISRMSYKCQFKCLTLKKWNLLVSCHQYVSLSIVYFSECCYTSSIYNEYLYINNGSNYSAVPLSSTELCISHSFGFTAATLLFWFTWLTAVYTEKSLKTHYVRLAHRQTADGNS